MKQRMNAMRADQSSAANSPAGPTPRRLRLGVLVPLLLTLPLACDQRNPASGPNANPATTPTSASAGDDLPTEARTEPAVPDETTTGTRIGLLQQGQETFWIKFYHDRYAHTVTAFNSWAGFSDDPALAYIVRMRFSTDPPELLGTPIEFHLPVAAPSMMSSSDPLITRVWLPIPLSDSLTGDQKLSFNIVGFETYRNRRSPGHLVAVPQKYNETFEASLRSVGAASIEFDLPDIDPNVEEDALNELLNPGYDCRLTSASDFGPQTKVGKFLGSWTLAKTIGNPLLNRDDQEWSEHDDHAQRATDEEQPDEACATMLSSVLRQIDQLVVQGDIRLQGHDQEYLDAVLKVSRLLGHERDKHGGKRDLELIDAADRLIEVLGGLARVRIEQERHLVNLGGRPGESEIFEIAGSMPGPEWTGHAKDFSDRFSKCAPARRARVRISSESFEEPVEADLVMPLRWSTTIHRTANNVTRDQVPPLQLLWFDLAARERPAALRVSFGQMTDEALALLEAHRRDFFTRSWRGPEPLQPEDWLLDRSDTMDGLYFSHYANVSVGDAIDAAKKGDATLAVQWLSALDDVVKLFKEKASQLVAGASATREAETLGLVIDSCGRAHTALSTTIDLARRMETGDPQARSELLDKLTDIIRRQLQTPQVTIDGNTRYAGEDDFTSISSVEYRIDGYSATRRFLAKLKRPIPMDEVQMKYELLDLREIK